MYPVTDEYLEAIARNTVVTDWYGKIRCTNGVVYEITPSVIVQGSGKLTRQICTKTDQIQIGTTCAAELDLSLKLDNVNRYEMMGAEVTLDFRLELSHGVWEEVPLGVFEITDPPERSVNVIKISAFDNMMKFNQSFGRTVQGAPYQILKYLCEDCGVELGTTQEEIANFPNGLVNTWNSAEVQVYTYRDLLGHLAAYLGCFAYIGPDGLLYLKPYSMTADREISESWRFEYKPKDYEAYYSSLTAYFSITQEYEQVVLSSYGLDYELPTNPFLQFNDNDVRLACLTNIITKLNEAQYTPFSGKFPIDPSIMPGDVINFTGNHAVDGKLACVTKQVIKMNGKMELSCGGDDPNLNVMTETEKKIQTAAKNSNKDGMYYYDYVNVSAIKIRDGKTARILLFNYTTTKETHVDFHGEIKCSVDTTEDYDEDSDVYTENDGVLYVTYYQGGDPVTNYYPVDTFFDGTHLLHLFYSWWASGNIVSSFEVYLRVTGCDLTIETGASRGTIEGIGLVGDVAWDGGVYINDEFPMIDFGTIRKELTDSLDVTPIIPGTEETVQKFTKLSFFKTMMKSMKSEIVDYGLQRFSAVYNNDDVEKSNVTKSGNNWIVTDSTAGDGIVTTYNVTVERILKITSNRTPNSGDVTYLVSFDDGETWYTYAGGFVLYDEEHYGMVEATMESITQAEWAEMLADTGTIKVQATLQGDSTLQDIQIFTWETTSWLSQGPEAAYDFDERYVTNEGDQVVLITSGYMYEGEDGSIDEGNLQTMTIDTSVFSVVNSIEARDEYDNILSDEQMNLSSWTFSATSWIYSNSYVDGVNTLTLLTKGGWESVVLEAEVETDTDYVLSLYENCPAGYTVGSGNSRRAFVWSQDWAYSNADRSLTDSKLLGYTDTWATAASDVPVQYTTSFNSGSNSKIRIELTFGSLTDDQNVTMLFRSIRLKKAREV